MAKASKTNEPVQQLVDQTIAMNKQALVFVNSKRSAEAVAEELAKSRTPTNFELGKTILKALSSPTKQCKRLAFCAERGFAFHHAGLVAKQRHAIEDAFLKGDLKVICATPTLAAGVNLPAFRVIVRDLYRFDGYMQEIPVLEYQQMCGRAGRPDFHDDFGEAITIAKSEGDAAWIADRYWDGIPEPITSKLASLPALRSAVLSLYAGKFVRSTKDVHEFFSKTFFAHQYGNIQRLTSILDEVENQLTEWGFLLGNDATPLGRRVSQLYLDPYSANTILTAIRSKNQKADTAIMHALCCCVEMRPLLRLKASDFAEDQTFDESLLPEPSMFSAEYEDFLAAAKTASMLNAWMDEAKEDFILEAFGVRPGELRYKIETGDWLLYSATELAKLISSERAPFFRARIRLKYGVKTELIPLMRLKGVGRVRARKLFSAGFTALPLVAKAKPEALEDILGARTAKSVVEQLAGSRSNLLKQP